MFWSTKPSWNSLLMNSIYSSESAIKEHKTNPWPIFYSKNATFDEILIGANLNPKIIFPSLCISLILTQPISAPEFWSWYHLKCHLDIQSIDCHPAFHFFEPALTLPLLSPKHGMEFEHGKQSLLFLWILGITNKTHSYKTFLVILFANGICNLKT